MSIEHTPPSTYILRELHDVTVPDSVSWMPQTVGWKILLVIILITLFFLALQRVRSWWYNRYRGEALAAINSLRLDDPNFEDNLYSILKVVLVYLDSANGKLFGAAMLQKLDTLAGANSTFDSDIGEHWLRSLVEPSVVLDSVEREHLKTEAMGWVKSHQGQHIGHVSLGGYITNLLSRHDKQGEDRRV